jgi:hypothetical protein
MSEYEELREDVALVAKSLDGYSSLVVNHLLEQSTQIDRLWADNAELRDELHAVANRLQNLTAFVTASPAEVAAAIVTDANRGTLREVRGDDGA